MSTYEQESKIRKLFETARREDRRQAPAFHDVLEGLETRPETAAWRSSPWWLRMAWVSALALLVLIPAIWMIRSDREAVPGELAANLEVLEWESPTDFLLAYPDETLFSDIPSVEVELESWVGPTEGFQQ